MLAAAPSANARCTPRLWIVPSSATRAMTWSISTSRSSAAVSAVEHRSCAIGRRELGDVATHQRVEAALDGETSGLGGPVGVHLLVDHQEQHRRGRDRLDLGDRPEVTGFAVSYRSSRARALGWSSSQRAVPAAHRHRRPPPRSRREIRVGDDRDRRRPRSRRSAARRPELGAERRRSVMSSRDTGDAAPPRHVGRVGGAGVLHRLHQPEQLRVGEQVAGSAGHVGRTVGRAARRHGQLGLGQDAVAVRSSSSNQASSTASDDSPPSRPSVKPASSSSARSGWSATNDSSTMSSLRTPPPRPLRTPPAHRSPRPTQRCAP